MTKLLGAVFIILFGAGISPAEQTFDVVSFSMKPMVTTDAPWNIQSTGDGKGVYRIAVAGNAVEVPISLTVATLQRIEKGKSGMDMCESKVKNIARTGEKTIAYGVGPTVVKCTFNYSDSSALMDTVAVFQGIVQTIQTGDKLKHDHRFDHLGLDADLDALTAAVKSGYAIELQNIQPVLQSIVDDDEMMSPVRRKATGLLAMAKLQAAPSAR